MYVYEYKDTVSLLYYIRLENYTGQMIFWNSVKYFPCQK
jgi:hypothetical protein